MNYKKTQIGWLIIGIFLPILFIFYLAYENQWGSNPIPLDSFKAIVLIFVIIVALFYKLTIEIDGQVLKLSYGIGLIRIKFKIDQLEEVQVIKTPWYSGLGIRFTSKGMLYNIHGLKAVRIIYISNGKSKSVMVGTAEPERLKEALEGSFL